MVQVTATIDGGLKLRCWIKAISSLAKVGENLSFEINETSFVLAAFNPSRSVHASANFGSLFFKSYKYTADSRLSKTNDAPSSKFQLQAKVCWTSEKPVVKNLTEDPGVNFPNDGTR
jgi:hypothetical protein